MENLNEIFFFKRIIYLDKSQMAAPGSASDLKEADADIQGHVDNVILNKIYNYRELTRTFFTCFKNSNSYQMKL